jgi:hypothetical protein
MQKGKRVDLAVLLYIIMLVIIVVLNMFNNVRILDVIYLGVLFASILKFLIVKRR